MGKSKAPEYQTTTTKTGGLFGESTNSKTGSNFKAEDWQTNMGGLGSNLINQSLTGLSSNDYSQDPNFQVYQDNFNRGMQQAYDTNVLGNLTDRGLMRSSGLQAATNSFNNTMQQGLADLYDSYYNRQQNNLNSALNAQNNLYSWITGLNQALTRRHGSTAVMVLRIAGADPDELFTMGLECRFRMESRRKCKEGSSMKLLDQFSEDLLQKAASMDPVIGRDAEIETVIGILSRKNKNNPALVGEPGVGKTAIAEGLAQRIAAGNVPPYK